MGYIELSEFDRERYGAPERVPFNYGRFGLRAVDALEREVGWTFEDLGNNLRKRKLDADGNPVQVPETDDAGNPLTDAEGNPKLRDVIKPSGEALAALVWLCLWSAGVKVAWSTFDVIPAGLRIAWGDDDEGKAPTPEG